MPNHTYSKATFVLPDFNAENPVDVKFIKDLKDATEKGELLEFLCPIGEWDYQTANEKWGTKWDIYDVSIVDADLENGRFTATFNTAWSPALDALENAGQRGGHFAQLYIQYLYIDEGGFFCGEAEFENGKVNDGGVDGIPTGEELDDISEDLLEWLCDNGFVDGESL